MVQHTAIITISFFGGTCYPELAQETRAQIEYKDSESTDSPHRVNPRITWTSQLLCGRAY